MLKDLDRKKVLSWAFYDWANSAFATTVVAGFFPIFLADYWGAGLANEETSFGLGIANSCSAVIVALLSPVIGAIADRAGAKKRFLFFFALLGIVMTGGLVFVSEGRWMTALVLFGVAVIGWSTSNSVYDSLIVSVAKGKRLDLISALGFACGYLGGGVLFTVNVLMVLHPDWFGIPDASVAVKLSFASVAVWWAVFSVPVFLFVPEPEVKERVGGAAAIAAGLRQVVRTIREIRSHKQIVIFLLAYWLYIDGVDTIIRMAVKYGKDLDFPSSSLIIALLVTQFVGFPAAIAFGRIGEWIGTKRGLLIGIGVYVGVCIWGYFMDQVWEFYALAVVIGLVQGGVQSLSRSFFARIIPEEKAAEFFGFYNMVGKYAAVIGPVLMSGVGYLTGDPRLGILSLILLLGSGGILLTRVREVPSSSTAGDCP